MNNFDLIEHEWRANYNIALSNDLVENPYSQDDLIFDGPFDLLLNMISDRKISIVDIKLSEITHQYIQYIKAMQEFDMDISSDFIDMAARLLYIKSKELLPLEDEEFEEVYEEEEYDIKSKLIIYSLFKEKAELLKERETLNRYSRSPEFSENDIRLSFINFNNEKLIDAYVTMLATIQPKSKAQQEKKIEKYEYSITDRIRVMLDKLIKSKKMHFMSLFNSKSPSGEIITSFLAVLELCKIQAINADMDGVNDILIEMKDNIDVEQLMKEDFDLEYKGENE